MRLSSFCLALVILIANFPAHAETTPVSIADGQVLRGEFSQERTLAGFKAPLKSTGDFVLSPSQGLIWRTRTPFQITTVISPTGLVQYAAGSEVLRLSASRMPVLSSFYELVSSALSGNQKALGDRFTVHQTTGTNGWRIDLTPRDDEASPPTFESVSVQGARFANEILILKPRGDRDKVTFSGQQLSTDPLSKDEAALLSGQSK